jgi:hypothetical protein
VLLSAFQIPTPILSPLVTLFSPFRERRREGGEKNGRKSSASSALSPAPTTIHALAFGQAPRAAISPARIWPCDPSSNQGALIPQVSMRHTINPGVGRVRRPFGRCWQRRSSYFYGDFQHKHPPFRSAPSTVVMVVGSRTETRPDRDVLALFRTWICQ